MAANARVSLSANLSDQSAACLLCLTQPGSLVSVFAAAMASLLLFLLIASSSVSAATFKQELEGVFSTAGEDLPVLSVVRLCSGIQIQNQAWSIKIY